MIIPSASDANQWCQIVRAGAGTLWNNSKPDCSTDPRNGSSDNRRRKQSENVARLVQTERRAKVAFDESGHEHRFASVA